MLKFFLITGKKKTFLIRLEFIALSKEDKEKRIELREVLEIKNK